MKLLWIKTDFLHPTTRGGQIRTLEMLKRLHQRHEIHYVAFEDGNQKDAIERSSEYCTRAYSVPHHAPPRRSIQFGAQLVRGLFSSQPVSIDRYRSAKMRAMVAQLLESERFDHAVCDFLTPAVNIPNLSPIVLFQHNVETIIWERHAAVVRNRLEASYLARQARLMEQFERSVCRRVRHVVAVSESDAAMLHSRFQADRVSHIPTGVDMEFFKPRGQSAPVADLVFVGSMDWLPNIDGIRFFVREVLPLIRQQRGNCSLAIVGRRPGPELEAMARKDPLIQVTGTVEDVRPFLWGSTVSIVPLRVGGGTRLKIYEAMAANLPVVSTSIGAEGLHVNSPGEIRLADTAQAFAAECIELLANAPARRTIATAASEVVSRRFSWEAVSKQFEGILGQT
jgi:sugar transferase (PEP-CTERM/EpsH1 system associated)